MKRQFGLTRGLSLTHPPRCLLRRVVTSELDGALRREPDAHGPALLCRSCNLARLIGSLSASGIYTSDGRSEHRALVSTGTPHAPIAAVPALSVNCFHRGRVHPPKGSSA